MRTRTVVATLAVAAAVTFGAAGTALAQQSDPAPAADAAGKGARKEFVCGHQNEIKDLLGQRKALAASRLSLLKEARQEAVDAGAKALVVRIDKRIATAAKAQERVETRTQKFTTWVGENCTG